MLAGHLLAVLEPDRSKHFDELADQRRELFVSTDSTGMVIVRGQLEPCGGAAFKTLIEALSAPHRGPVCTDPSDADQPGQPGQPEQTELVIEDLRTPAQRRHDGLLERVRLATGNLEAGVRAGEPPRVVVHTTVEQLAAVTGGPGTAFIKPTDATDATSDTGATTAPGAAQCEATGPITAGVLGALACDAVIERVLLGAGGKILAMQTLGRFFTPAQRRALAARDGGCAFPGCDRPPTWTDAHHVIFWAHGGPTTVDNGVLLCGPHHTTIHFGKWRIVM